jgi:hypothetical protein
MRRFNSNCVYNNFKNLLQEILRVNQYKTSSKFYKIDTNYKSKNCDRIKQTTNISTNLILLCLSLVEDILE